MGGIGPCLAQNLGKLLFQSLFRTKNEMSTDVLYFAFRSEIVLIMGRPPKVETPSTSSGLKKSKRTAHDDFLEDNWDCPVCTFKNPRNLYKCKVSLV